MLRTKFIHVEAGDTSNRFLAGAVPDPDSVENVVALFLYCEHLKRCDCLSIHPHVRPGVSLQNLQVGECA